MPRESDTLNEYLRRFREDTKGTENELMQADIALAIGKSQSLLSKIERGLADLTKWKPSELYELLLAYRQTPAHMLRLANRFGLRKLTTYIEERNRMLGVGEGARVRYLGVISAGMLGASEVMDVSQQATVSAPDAIADKYRLEDVFAVNVVGDSMLDQEARDSIPPGSLVFFHSRLSPEVGEIVCVYLPRPDQTVIKRWHPGHGYAVLTSHNPHHEPIVVTSEDEAILQGVYLTHIPETPRLR